MDIYGQALADFYNSRPEQTLWLNNSYGEAEEMPVEVFFRDQSEMPSLELLALEKCRGRVLDIGAGAGSHTLLLQKKFETTALEISETACRIMQMRGVKNIVNEDFFRFKDEKFDTLLLLMNGIGLCGDLNGLDSFLEHCKNLLTPGGQIIFDSSDISYLYEEGLPLPDHYYGEIRYQYRYKGLTGDWLNWLYADFQTVERYAGKHGWRAEKIYEDEHDQYLALLSPVERRK